MTPIPRDDRDHSAIMIDPRIDPGLTLELVNHIESVCTDFESQWQCGHPPAIKDMLEGATGLKRSALLRELLAIELEQKGCQGLPPTRAAYAETFPDDLAIVDLVFCESADAARPASLANGNRIRGAQGGLPCDFGAYELVQEIARGGMGVVYKARHRKLNRTVAVKMILAGQLASDADVDRFYIEAEAAAGLEHSNIVPIFDVGHCDGNHYFSMGFVEGESLAERINRGAIPPRETAQLLLSIANAVHYAHCNGVIHRDLKPGNILIDKDDNPHVTDFGLAKRVDADRKLTLTGQLIGTPSFMSPEQASGNRGPVGLPTDIYSLGAVLYTMLVGHPPFRAASTLETLKQALEQEPISPRSLNNKVPRDLETICLKCLEKDPRRRYASALELAKDLERFLDDRPIQARRAGQVEHAWRFARRNPWSAGLAGAVVLLCVTVAIVAVVSRMWLKDALSESEKGRQRIQAANAEAQTQLWASYLSQAKAIRSSHQVGQRVEGLRAIRSALQLPTPDGRSIAELRNEAIACLLLPDFEVWKEWDDQFDRGRGFAIDQSFERYARGDTQGNVTVRAVADDRELFALPGAGFIHDWCLDFSRDGRTLLHSCIGSHGLHSKIWKLNKNKAEVAFEGDRHILLRPDGRQFAVAKETGFLQLFDTETGEEIRRYPIAGRIFDWSWSPTFSKIAIRNDQGCGVLDLESGERIPFGMYLNTYGMSWDSTGRTIALVMDHQIHFWDFDKKCPAMPPLAGHKADGVRVRFNHADTQVLSLDWSGLWRLWDVRSGTQLLTLPSKGDVLTFSQDNQLVAADTSTPRIRLFRLHSGDEFRRLAHFKGDQSSVYEPQSALCADGRLLAIQTPDGVALVDIARNEEVGLVAIPSNQPFWFDANRTELWTKGSRGLLSWPLQFEPSADECRVGPPKWLGPVNTSNPVGVSADGQCLAIPGFEDDDTAVLWRLSDNRKIALRSQDDVRSCDVSPDGRWAATGSHSLQQGVGAKIWNAAGGTHVADLPVDEYCGVRFSPDNQWLLTTGGRLRIWRVGTWAEGPRLRAAEPVRGFAFSSDGKLLAVGDSKGAVRLLAPDTGEELAQLISPEPTRLLPLHFTPDGARLITLGAETSVLYIIDLRAIRGQLHELGLDWDQPQLPPPNAVAAAPIRLKIIFDDTPSHRRTRLKLRDDAGQ